ncbi:hypothetical protein Ancab_031408, partial [Ancistrocladus abbreviatus]
PEIPTLEMRWSTLGTLDKASSSQMSMGNRAKGFTQWQSGDGVRRAMDIRN